MRVEHFLCSDNKESSLLVESGPDEPGLAFEVTGPDSLVILSDEDEKRLLYWLIDRAGGNRNFYVEVVCYGDDRDAE